MQNSKVTIIIPIYNTEKYLRQCLDSVIGQTHCNLQIICVNDGSTDNSKRIIKEYSENDERIMALDKANGGQSSARNCALKFVEGEYVMYLDSDDWIDPDTIEIMLSEAYNENADSVMCSYVREYSNKSLKTNIFESSRIVFDSAEAITKFHRRLFGPLGEELSRPDRVDAPISACMQLFKKEIAVSSSFVDTSLVGTFEDGLYQIDIYKGCHKIVYINKHLYHYRKTNQASTTSVYRPHLFDRWNHLYDLLFSKLTTYASDSYEEALCNRIALCFLPLCMNEVTGPGSVFEKSKRIKRILKTDLYSSSIKRLSLKYMPFKWKLFFIFAKTKITLGLVTIANYANHLRGKTA